MNAVAGTHFNRGQRAFFFSLAYLGWFVSPYLFIAATAGVLYVMWRRQFVSGARAALDEERMAQHATAEEIEAKMLELVTARAGRNLDPTEIARALGGDKPEGWGPLMQPVRLAAIRLMKEGRLVDSAQGPAGGSRTISRESTG